MYGHARGLDAARRCSSRATAASAALSWPQTCNQSGSVFTQLSATAGLASASESPPSSTATHPPGAHCETAAAAATPTAHAPSPAGSAPTHLNRPPCDPRRRTSSSMLIASRGSRTTLPPSAAIQRGLLTIEKKGKINVFNGRVLEIEGLPDLTVEQAFELADATAERSAGGCTIDLSEETVAEYLRSNVTMLRWMRDNGYGDPRTIERRARAMEEWLGNPTLLRADADAEYADVIEIDMSEIKEPLLACPNDPDDVKPLSEVAGRQIDEVFIGSCMTNIGHFRAAGKLLEAAGQVIPTRLWVAPPTKMDEVQLKEEGFYSLYAAAGARTEMPGCSLCMGNQARIAPNSTAVSTSTRNFPNRLGQGADVFLASAELAAIASVLGKLPTIEEYMEYANQIDAMGADIYRYLNFDQIPEYVEASERAKSVEVELA